MTSYKVPQGTVEAARSLLASPGLRVDQVHEIVLRGEDANEDPETARVVRFVPIGGVIGIAITPHGEMAKDADFVFVSARAFGSAIPALGFTGSVSASPQMYLHSPEGDWEKRLEMARAVLYGKADAVKREEGESRG